jgi:hypothetical protein
LALAQRAAFAVRRATRFAIVFLHVEATVPASPGGQDRLN